MSSVISGTTWKAQYTIGKDGRFKASVSPKPVSFVLKDITFEGSVALEITGRLVPDMPKTAPQPVPVPVGERVTQWFEENGQTALGVGLLVGAGILVVATIGEDIITLGAGIVDDPASFAAASAMASGGLRLIAR